MVVKPPPNLPLEKGEGFKSKLPLKKWGFKSKPPLKKGGV
tara:strand:- start:6254 stop:6373 length:120 start_codon:yes stop_codon:yes gene_type:complete